MQRLAQFTIACLVSSLFLAAQKTPVGYSAEEVREFSQTLSNGVKIHTETHTKIFQDSQGRLRNDSGDVAVIYDPVADVAYQLDLTKQTAYRLAFNISYEEPMGPSPKQEKGVIYIKASPQGPGYRFSASISFPPQGPGRLTSRSFSGSSIGMGPGGASTDPVAAMKEQAVMQLMNSVQHVFPMSRQSPQTEQLGTQTFGGFVATGTRHTTTYAAGAIGNDQAFQSVMETWTSADLGRSVLTKNTDPRNGDSTTQLINISKGDPDLSVFQPPSGFKLENAPAPAPKITAPAR